MQGIVYFVVMAAVMYLMLSQLSGILPGFRVLLSKEWLWSIALAVGAVNAVLGSVLHRSRIIVFALSLLVLNVVVIRAAAWIAPRFGVDGYLATLLPAVVLSIAGMACRSAATALLKRSA